MAIFVTGAAGFIGSHLCEYLMSQGREVVGLDNFNSFYDPEIKQSNIQSVEKTASQTGKSFIFYAGDIRHQQTIRQIFAEHKIDGIIHLAAMAGVRPSMQNPLLYVDVNESGTMTLLEEARQAHIKKFVFASSSSVYGNNEKTPFSETDPVDNPISYYAATKKAGELICHVAYKTHGFSVACLRFFTVYGPRQRPDLAIHKFTQLLFSGKKIPVYGDGTKSRDFTYVNDTIDGIYKSFLWLEKSALPQYEIFNLGESKTASVIKLIELLEKASGIKAEREFLPDVPGDVNVTYADVSKAKKMLGYDPRIQIEEGIPEFVKWFKSANRL